MKHSQSMTQVKPRMQTLTNQRSSANLKTNETDNNPFVSTYSLNFNNPQEKKKPIHTSQSNKNIFKQQHNQRYSNLDTDLYNQIAYESTQRQPQVVLNLKKDLQNQKSNNDRFKRNSDHNQYKSNKDVKKSPEKPKPQEKITITKVEHHKEAKPNKQVESHSAKKVQSSKQEKMDQSYNTLRHELLTMQNSTQNAEHQNQSQYLQKMQHAKGQKRIIDRFVKYPYPTNIITNYKKDYRKSMQEGLFDQSVKEAFNLEKEHKIINPHQMDLKTTTRVDFKPFTVVPQAKGVAQNNKQKVPIIDRSAYTSEFQNWGSSDYLIEKTPQYPVYCLPFKGQSVYAQSFKNSDTKERFRPESANSNRQGTQSQLRLMGFQPMQANYETTQHKDFQPFKILQRPQTSKPKVDVVRTTANPGHFQTHNSRVFTPFENYKPPEVDFMPYP